MNNTYLSESEIRLIGIQRPKKLAKLIEGKGYLQTKSPDGTPEDRYEFYPYRVICYHKVAEDIVRKFVDNPDLKFEILHD